ncbi:MAG: hypothetical protein HY453_02435 [Parcubacteria group bacterium]|nr:hypothetical protein [Parcubacteria group bacterium]
MDTEAKSPDPEVPKLKESEEKEEENEEESELAAEQKEKKEGVERKESDQKSELHKQAKDYVLNIIKKGNITFSKEKFPALEKIFESHPNEFSGEKLQEKYMARIFAEVFDKRVTEQELKNFFGDDAPEKLDDVVNAVNGLISEKESSQDISPEAIEPDAEIRKAYEMPKMYKAPSSDAIESMENFFKESENSKIREAREKSPSWNLRRKQLDQTRRMMKLFDDVKRMYEAYTHQLESMKMKYEGTGLDKAADFAIKKRFQDIFKAEYGSTKNISGAKESWELAMKDRFETTRKEKIHRDIGGKTQLVEIERGLGIDTNLQNLLKFNFRDYMDLRRAPENLASAENKKGKFENLLDTISKQISNFEIDYWEALKKEHEDRKAIDRSLGFETKGDDFYRGKPKEKVDEYVGELRQEMDDSQRTYLMRNESPEFAATIAKLENSNREKFNKPPIDDTDWLRFKSQDAKFLRDDYVKDIQYLEATVKRFDDKKLFLGKVEKQIAMHLKKLQDPEQKDNQKLHQYYGDSLRLFFDHLHSALDKGLHEKDIRKVYVELEKKNTEIQDRYLGRELETLKRHLDTRQYRGDLREPDARKKTLSKEDKESLYKAHEIFAEEFRKEFITYSDDFGEYPASLQETFKTELVSATTEEDFTEAAKKYVSDISEKILKKYQEAKTTYEKKIADEQFSPSETSEAKLKFGLIHGNANKIAEKLLTLNEKQLNSNVEVAGIITTKVLQTLKKDEIVTFPSTSEKEYYEADTDFEAVGEIKEESKEKLELLPRKELPDYVPVYIHLMDILAFSEKGASMETLISDYINKVKSADRNASKISVQTAISKNKDFFTLKDGIYTLSENGKEAFIRFQHNKLPDTFVQKDSYESLPEVQIKSLLDRRELPEEAPIFIHILDALAYKPDGLSEQEIVNEKSNLKSASLKRILKNTKFINSSWNFDPESMQYTITEEGKRTLIEYQHDANNKYEKLRVKAVASAPLTPDNKKSISSTSEPSAEISSPPSIKETPPEPKDQKQDVQKIIENLKRKKALKKSGAMDVPGIEPHEKEKPMDG